MPNDIEQLNKKFEELSGTMSTMRKDFELKLESAQKDAKEYKELAIKREEELRQFKADSEKSAREKEAQLAASREGEIKAFVEEQVKAGRLLPAKREAVLAFMRTLSADTQAIEFSEKDGSTRKTSQMAIFKDLIQSFKKAVSFGEEYTVAGMHGAETPLQTEGEETEQFMEIMEEGVRKKLPVLGTDLHNAAVAYQEEKRKIGISVSYYDALIEVSPKNRRITVKA